MTALPRKCEHGAQYFRSMRRAGLVPRSPKMEGLKAAERALAAAAVLPSPLDYEVSMGPVRTAWVRSIPPHNLWLFYRVRDDVVYLLHVANSPPIAIDID